MLATHLDFSGIAPATDSLSMARSRYRYAEHLSCRPSQECVDAFYSAVLWGWQAGASECDSSAQRITNQALARLLHEGRSRGCFDLQHGLEVNFAGETRHVPIECIGFPWSKDDFHELRVVGHYYHCGVSQYQSARGLGVPVVILRTKPKGAPHTDDFLPRTAAFPATAVMMPDGLSLRLYDPLRIHHDSIDGCDLSFARDTTADLVYGLHYHPQTRITDFLRPDQNQAPSLLYFAEPFQSNKIPVVFVHGLLSSPDAWVNVINQLRVYPEILDNYQFWGFKYATGAPFIRSAAELRSQLDAVVTHPRVGDHHHRLNHSVMVGHSMGGLIAKLAIAHSGDELWNSIAYLPIESVATDEATRARLIERLYFDPHPMIRRTIFVATPHRGSITAGRICGRLASALVQNDDSTFEQLREDNIGGFNDSLASGLPSSIDMLDPSQPFLETIGRLPLNPSVSKHTILGNKFHVAGHHPSDGVVSETSAQHPESLSEKKIAATHNGLLRHPETIQELLRILRLHLTEEPTNDLPLEKCDE